MGMCLAGVPTRRIEGSSETLWRSSVSATTVSSLNEKAFASVGEWRNRSLARPPLRLRRRHLSEA